MSINDFINKIKKKLNIDTFTIMCLFVIIGVGIGSFGLGRLSTLDNDINNNDEITIIDMNDNESLFPNNDFISDIDNINKDISKEKRYVASRSGKFYYSIGCPGSKRISEKNMIWFNTKEDAEKSGYTFSTSCK